MTANCYPKRRFLGTREFLDNGQRGAYEWYSYQEIFRLSCLLSAGLTEIGLKRGDKVGIIGPNRTEWTVIEMACGIAGIVLVPIYDTQSAEDISYVCDDADLKVCFSSLDRVGKIAHVKSKFNTVVVFDDRVDDRAYIQETLNQDVLPQFTVFQPRSQETFDQFDKEEGIFDPVAPNKARPQLDADGCSNRICRVRKDKNNFFNYKIEQKWVNVFKKQQQAVDISFVTNTFWQLVQFGYQKLYSYDSNQVYASNVTIPVNIDETSPDSLLSLVYTSGTTGRPKGVMLNHSNVCWAAYALNKTRLLKEERPVNSLGQQMTDRQEFMLSFLPLAHIYMRSLQGVQICNGGALDYMHGSTNTLLADVQELRITAFILVPRIIQKVYDGISTKLERSSFLKQALFKKAYAARLKMFKAEQIKIQKQFLTSYNNKTTPKPLQFVNQARLNYQKTTSLVFNQFPKMLGGRCRIAVTGSAPLSQTHGEFMSICFNLHLIEGFGMTETSAHGTVQRNDTVNYGQIGEGVEGNTKLRIQSVPEMGYNVSDEKVLDIGGQQVKAVCPRGELLIKGPSVFQGYYKDEAKTKESFVDGYFTTGDIAEFNPVTQEVNLIDRKRGIVKLSQGEFISINQIEDAISKSRFVEAVFLYANRYHAFTLAVVVPNVQYCTQKGFKSDENLAQSAAAIKMITEDIKKTCKQYQLKSFEIPKVVLIENEPWTPENGLLTPALKIKRPACKNKYEQILTSIIKKLEKIEGNDVGVFAEQVIKTLEEGSNLSEVEIVISGQSGLR
ncbi:Long_chain fatty acid CoA ligase [Hexamita inflata]|uniref:Long chain fatty acid CoA ligase n=1 Tax=Hexamita inflata TaxID=28002 RepID=A0AA86T9X9_9EUKA|nr:Long chain fatty acid CoA ligase [Hexamita inflata]